MIEQKYIDMAVNRISIEDVVSNYVPDLKRKGHRLWACCPFHKENTPSFCIDIQKNMWYCFGCHEGGNVIKFMMKIEGMSFPVAVKELLSKYLHIKIEEDKIRLSPEEEKEEKRKETMRIYNDILSKWFIERIESDSPDAKAAKAYAESRWDKEFGRVFGIGFAPDSWTAIVTFAEGKGLDFDILVEMGVIFKSEKNGKYYSGYRNRVMIPIRDDYGRIEGWTARTMDEREEKDTKYINSKNSLIYKKEFSVFGMDTAARLARILEKVNLVEGAADVMKMQSLGILNTVASLGGSWTDVQLRKLKKLHASLCLIPDSDLPKDGEEFGPGFKTAMKTGRKAIEMGFSVSVKEIPNNTGKKMDPDSYITSRHVFDSMHEEEFILWLVRKTWKGDCLAENRIKFIADICSLIVLINDEDLQQSYINTLADKYHHKRDWLAGMRSAKLAKEENNIKERSKENYEMLQSFGFSVNNGCYYGTGKDGAQVRWSNFTLTPHFHIKDDIRPVRIFDIRNNEPGSRAEVIELDMETITSSKMLMRKLYGMGNYVWYGDDKALLQLLAYLAQTTETATEVKQMGWNSNGFYCFCNGAQEDGLWIPVDSMGIVRLKSGNYYIPAMSQLYGNSTELFTNERKFIHKNLSKFTMRQYCEKIVTVFGDNGKVAICFLLATLFRDIIKDTVNFFPILNIFGPKGSGKTQLADTLGTFFMSGNLPPNVESASIPSISDTVASVCNAIVHLDEYKNKIDAKRIELLKDFWGGIGRFRMNMDKDKKREQARVDCGIVLTGQEMPTADIALFTRLIFLCNDKQHHTEEERKLYDDLLIDRKSGATHLTLEIIKHRGSFEARFSAAWKKAKRDLQEKLRGTEMIDRIEHNWAVPLSAYIALENLVDLPFTYEEILDICAGGAKRQNSLCNNTDEIAGFWNIISSAYQKGILKINQDFFVRTVTKLKIGKKKEEYNFEEPRKILMIRKSIFLSTYRELGKKMDEKLLPSESILHYLKNCPEYIGVTTDTKRFKKFASNGMPMQNFITDDKGNVLSATTVWEKDRPLCFDYPRVSEKYDIILDSDEGNNLEAAPEEFKDNVGDNDKTSPLGNETDISDDAPF